MDLPSVEGFETIRSSLKYASMALMQVSGAQSPASYNSSSKSPGNALGVLDGKGAHEMATSSQFSLVNMGGAVVLATVAVASCAAPHSLQQVKTSNPSVTYEYRGDQELFQAQQNAVTFCDQYQAAPRPARFTIFKCDPNLPAAAPPQQALGPNLNYSYRTDQELLDASRSAETYCMNNGSRQVVSSIATNADGSRTVMFQCTPRA
jgi:hypothetical protein